MLCYVMLCYVMLCYVMLCYVIVMLLLCYCYVIVIFSLNPGKQLTRDSIFVINASISMMT